MTQARRDQLEDMLRQRGFAALGELSSLLDVSESTIRRDLEHLERAGTAKRTHGGVFWTGGSQTMAVFQNRSDDSWAAKSGIAQAAAALIEDHETVLLDGGSTTYEMARALVGRRLQVVTNSLPVAQLLFTGGSIDLVLIGGCVRGQTAVSIGPLAMQQLSQLRVTTAVLSVAGVLEEGFFNSDMMLVESEREMLRCSDRSIVVADHSKFGKGSLSRICGLSEIDAVITDTGLPDAWKDRLARHDVDVVLAACAHDETNAAHGDARTTPSKREMIHASDD
ncbi:MAG: DeoR/GlpR family DNA-binding transcription regulator [Planctomycetota bacterium]